MMTKSVIRLAHRVVSLYVLAPIAHVWTRSWRRGSGAAGRAVVIVRLLMAAGVLFGSYVAGRTLVAAVHAANLSFDPLLAVDRFLLLGLAAFYVVQLVRRRWADLNLTPYKQWPLSAEALAVPLVVIGLFNTPFLAFVLFLAGIDGSRAPTGGAIPGWLVLGLLLAVIHFLAEITKHFISSGRGWRIVFVALVPSLLLLGYLSGAEALYGTSVRFSMLLSQASTTGMVILFFAIAASFLTVVYLRSRTVETPVPAGRRVSLLAGGLTSSQGILRVAALDLLMLQRNRYPRYLIRLTVVITILLLPSLLVLDDPGFNLVTLVLVAVIPMAAYAQVGFAWHAEHYDGLMVLPVSEDDHIRGRVAVCNILILGSILLAAPFVAVATFDFPDSLIVAYVFASGACVLPLLVVALRWSKRIVLSAGAIENAGGYSWQQYIFIFGVWVLVDLAVGLSSLQTAALILLVVGGAGLALHPAGMRRLSSMLRREAPQIATRFRITS